MMPRKHNLSIVFVQTRPSLRGWVFYFGDTMERLKLIRCDLEYIARRIESIETEKQAAQFINELQAKTANMISRIDAELESEIHLG